MGSLSSAPNSQQTGGAVPFSKTVTTHNTYHIVPKAATNECYSLISSTKPEDPKMWVDGKKFLENKYKGPLVEGHCSGIFMGHQSTRSVFKIPGS